MSVSIVEASDVSQPSMGNHLVAQEVAAYVDRALGINDVQRIEAHLADCAECRAEVTGVMGILGALPSRRRVTARHWMAAAAAAVVLLVAWPRDARDPGDRGPIHRESPVTATIAPRTLSPSGTVSAPLVLRWSSVPKADGYRARVYDAQGSVLFERETIDTTIALPASVGLRSGTPYYWKVEARTGFDRSAASELIEFTLQDRP